MIREDIEEIRKKEEENKQIAELNLKLSKWNTFMCLVIMICGLINALHIIGLI